MNEAFVASHSCALRSNAAFTEAKIEANSCWRGRQQERKLLKRPENEKPFLLIPVGYAADECWVPDIQRKQLDEVAVFYE